MSTPSAEQIEKRVARSKDRWKTPLDVENIPAVDRPHNRTLSGADIIFTSTPKTAVRSPPMVTLENSPPKEVRPKMTPGRITPIGPQTSHLFSPLSPSIYSRNTDGMSILPNDSVMSLTGTIDDHTRHGGGSAVIITSHAVRSHVIGTPSPKRGTESNRSSRDWKAWLSHEVSELDANPQSDYAFQGSYTPTARQHSPTPRHHREYTQIEEEDTQTIIVRQSIDTVTPWQGPGIEDMPVEQSIESDVTDTISPPQDTLSTTPPVQVKSSVDPSPMRKVSPPLTLNSVPRRQRLSSLSSAFSQGSSPSAPTNSTPKSARMNERFPFIKSNRSSSSHIAQPRRSSHTPSHNSSGSSSLNAKATPSPKLYSDLSAPSTNRTSKYEPNTRSKRREEVITDDKVKNDENRKENVTPTTQIRRLEQSRSGTALSLPIAIARPKSMLPLSSVTLNRSPSTLSRYTTTTEDGNFTEKTTPPVNPERNVQRQRLTVKTRPISPSKLTTKSKSAFDLRGMDLSPMAAHQVNISTQMKTKAAPVHQVVETIGKKQQQTKSSSRISTSTAGLDTDTLRMLLESPWAVSGAPSSPRTSLELAEVPRPRLRVKHSSSTLALNKEPSPGLEDRIIDSILVCEEKATSMRSGIEGCASGRGTPGQRMAERFLRERSAPKGSGAGSPVDVSKEGSASAAGGKLKREDTPAFL
jgi:hypothetical protein